jgi:hypothetical protein
MPYAGVTLVCRAVKDLRIALVAVKRPIGGRDEEVIAAILILT